MMSKDMWIEEHERILDEYVSEILERGEAFERLKRLGLSPDEADEQLDMAEA